MCTDSPLRTVIRLTERACHSLATYHKFPFDPFPPFVSFLTRNQWLKLMGFRTKCVGCRNTVRIVFTYWWLVKSPKFWSFCLRLRVPELATWSTSGWKSRHCETFTIFFWQYVKPFWEFIIRTKNEWSMLKEKEKVWTGTETVVVNSVGWTSSYRQGALGWLLTEVTITVQVPCSALERTDVMVNWSRAPSLLLSRPLETGLRMRLLVKFNHS